MSWSNPVALDLHHFQSYRSRGETQTPHRPSIPVRPPEGLQGTATREAKSHPHVPGHPPPPAMRRASRLSDSGCHSPSGW